MADLRKCRLWWPANASSEAPPRSSYLFGWFISSSDASLDIVVAFTCDESTLSAAVIQRFDIQEFLLAANKHFPASLQDKCKLSMIGCYVGDHNVNGLLPSCGNNKKTRIQSTSGGQCLSQSSNACIYGCSRCGCNEHDGLLERVEHTALENGWIKLVYCLSETVDERIHGIPKLDHLHWNMGIACQLDIHIIIYEIPTFSGHHYCAAIPLSFTQGSSTCGKPQWFENLHQKDTNFNLQDLVILAVNCANVVQMLFGDLLHVESGIQFQIVYKITNFLWRLFAAYVASISTIIYIFLQCAHVLLDRTGRSVTYSTLEKIFSNTFQNIQLRSCHILYWPTFFQDHGKRTRSCVEFAEKYAFNKHLFWSNIVVDLFLGSFLCIGFWCIEKSFCLWVSGFSHDITNYCLRISVWLMGNPAGFKLNSELAAVLGTISLTVIQVWSTLCVFIGPLFIHVTRGIAICGLFGLTTAAALVIDIISIATIHLFTLHLFLSFLYSTQLQTIAAIWRLFRGKKWNPLRQRLDSYDYSVEQHVVGSLLFTPILLLLPTTSAFYIFFSSLHTAVSFVCFVIEVTISLIHATPYAKIFIWLKTKKRFPSGIWFDIISSNHFDTGDVGISNPSTGKRQNTAYASGTKSTVLLSFLQSNYLNLGEVVLPHYRHIFSTFSNSSMTAAAYGLLTGKSIPHPPRAGLPPKLPWMVMPWTEYWHLCHDAVYSLRGNPTSHLH